MNGRPLTAAVVDDEPLALRRAVRLLRRQPGFIVAGGYASVEEALAASLADPPDLFLVDVRMPDQDGFDFVRRLREHGCRSFVIFVTAYSQRAHEAFEVEAVDYVLKPFDEPRLARALERAQRALLQSRQAAGAPPAAAATAAATPTAAATAAATAPAAATVAAPLAPRLPPDRLLVSERGKLVILQHRDIEYVRAAGKYACVRAGGHYHILRQPLTVVESRLDARIFVRIHRSTIVNIDYITEMHALFHGDYEVILRSGERLQMSRRFRSRLSDATLGGPARPTGSPRGNPPGDGAD